MTRPIRARFAIAAAMTVGLLRTAAAEPWPEASMVVQTPALGSLSTRTPPFADRLPLAVRAWLPPVEPSHPAFDSDRSAWLVVDGDGIAVWLFPLSAEHDVAASLAEAGARLVQGASAWILPAPTPELEAACRVIPGRLACQRPVGPSGLAPLVRAAAPRPPAARAGEWTVFVAPRRLEAWAEAQWRRDAERRSRLLPPPARARVRRRAAERARSWTATLSAVDYASGRLAAVDPGLNGELTIQLSAERGWRVAPARPAHPRIVGWSHTPALVRAWARTEPDLAQHFIDAWIGRSLPGLSGDFSVLWLGIRADCPSGCADASGAYARFFPTAAAFGLASSAARREVDAWVGTSSTPTGRRKFVTAAGPAEVVIEEDALFMVTGEGLGSAATRRWERCRERTEPPETILSAQADLRAIRAALDAQPPDRLPPPLIELATWIDIGLDVVDPHRWIATQVTSSSDGRTLRISVESRP